MLPQTYTQHLNDVLFVFFFWLSAFVGLVALVVFLAIGVSVYNLMKEPASSRRSLLTAALLAILFIQSALAESPKIPLGLDLYMPVPASNPLQADKIALGRRLFFDRRLSRDKNLSCAGCHDPARGFTDGKAVSEGVFHRRGTRNVPTLVNRGYGTAFFWDGRISILEEQVLQPIQNPLEMDMAVEEVVARLRHDRHYRTQFGQAFGREISRHDLACALASYVRTILSGGSPYDRYLSGDQNALSTEAREGLRIFRGKGNCIACHVGPNLTDERFHNTGVAWRDGKLTDPGRFAVTGKDQDRGAFKPPTLREVMRTAPYMHDGSLKTLENVVDYYDRGGNQNPYLDSEVRPLHLTPAEKTALISFLGSLNGASDRKTHD
jgi:cytochrome c peroxidase